MVGLTSFHETKQPNLCAHPGGSHPVCGQDELPRYQQADPGLPREAVLGQPQNVDRCLIETTEIHPQSPAEMVLAWKLFRAGVTRRLPSQTRSPLRLLGAPTLERDGLSWVCQDKLTKECTLSDPVSWLVFLVVSYWPRASLVAQMVKNPPAMQENWVSPPSQEDPLEKGMVTHSSILAWRIPWTEEPGGLQSMGSQRVRQDWAANTFTFTSTNIRVHLFEIKILAPVPRLFLDGSSVSGPLLSQSSSSDVAKLSWYTF